LGDRADARLEELSHGNQQRVQLASAIVHDPELAVLDEPFSGLDPLGVESLAELLKQIAAMEVAVVFSSHQLDLVEDVCEDVVIIDHGRIVMAGVVEAWRGAES
jgi:ABC-2 type transport system ATP-binding protein